MYKVMFAALLAAGLTAAPFAQSFSTASAQQAGASGKTTSPTSATNATNTTRAKREPSAGQLAARERQKKCAAEWKDAKASGKTEKGSTWPKFWSDCNKRLKAAAK